MTILTSRFRRVLVVAACCLATPVAAQEVTISTTTESARRLFLDARDKFHMTRFAEARELLEETLEEEPGLALAHAYLALAESFTYHDPASSLAAARDPAATANSGERLMADALASFLDHDLAGAVSTLADVISAFPDDPYARHALGFTLVDFGVTREGIEVLESLLADRPNFVAAWNHLGYGYLDLGDLQQALGCLRRFVALAPDNPSAHDSLADGLATTGRIDEAIASLTRAALLDPRYAYAYLHLGDILTIEDELQLARASYRRAIDIDSPYGPGFSIVAWHRIAQSWLHGLDFEAARATYRTIIDLCDKLDADDDALAAERMLLTTLLVEVEGAAAQEVLHSLESRVDRLPESERAARESWISFYRGWLGVVEHDADVIGRMIDILEADPTRDPDRRLAARLRGEAALADLRFEDAATAFEMAGTSDPVVLVRLAAAYDGLGRQATAAALFNEAASCDTFDFECALARGLAQPLSWSPPPVSDPFDWEAIPPGAEEGVPDTIAGLGYLIRRPESHCIHHERGVHRYDYSDLPPWNIVFGTFDNPATFDEGEPAGCAAMRILDGVAWLDWAATSPEFRRRGSQGVLLSRRIADAVDLGVRMIATTTGEAVPGDPQHSYRNILRAGFRLSHSRANWVPEPESG